MNKSHVAIRLYAHVNGSECTRLRSTGKTRCVFISFQPGALKIQQLRGKGVGTLCHASHLSSDGFVTEVMNVRVALSKTCYRS